jgi:AraC-like DNA-binding protein
VTNPEACTSRAATFLDDDEVMRSVALACRYRVSRVVARFGISGRHLRRLFVDRMGCSPQAWLREERLQSARRALSTAATVKEVAYALAYTQESQFCRDFKRRFGHSPSKSLPDRPDMGELRRQMQRLPTLASRASPSTSQYTSSPIQTAAPPPTDFPQSAP